MLRTTLATLLLAVSMRAAAPCPQPVDVQPGMTLSDLAAKHLGNADYSTAVALATNARTSDGFSYIANPDDISKVKRVCIPAKPEANHLKQSWDTYDHAVSAARLPRMSELGKSLVTIPADPPVNVVAWVRTDQVARLKTASGGWVDKTAAETWVTVEPHLQDFCRRFAAERKADAQALTERLEQRLGLSPSSNKTTFVRMRLAQPGAAILFRPCMDASVDQANCPVGPPPAAATADHVLWLMKQYYGSYGQSLLSEFPWTALGYTFDWAQGPSNGFQRFGESEFVVRQGAPIQILETVETAQYCAAK